MTDNKQQHNTTTEPIQGFGQPYFPPLSPEQKSMSLQCNANVNNVLQLKK